jgi:hypothetical protein
VPAQVLWVRVLQVALWAQVQQVPVWVRQVQPVREE